MPWRESNHMDERKKFVARLIEGDKMTDVCQLRLPTEKCLHFHFRMTGSLQK